PVWVCDRLVSTSKVIENQVAYLGPDCTGGGGSIALPVGMLELYTHSSFEAVATESSLPPSKVALRSSSPTTSTPEIHFALILPAPSAIVISQYILTNIVAPSSEFPLAHVVSPPRIRPRRAILIRPEENIPIGRLYHTHPGGPCKALTVRKSFRPLPSHHLALRTPQCSVVYLRWRSAPLSTMYPPATSESSVGDSSSKSSAGPSRMRCRSPAANMTLSIHATRSLVPSRADLLLPRKKFRDSISPEDSVEEDIDTDVLEDIKTGQRELEARSMIAGGERASLLDEVASLERSNARLRDTMMMERARADRRRRRVRFMESELRQIRSMTPEAIKELVNRRVKEALAAYEVTRAVNALEAENQSQNGSDGDNGNGENRNGKNGNGGNGNPNENDRGARPIAREYIMFVPVSLDHVPVIPDQLPVEPPLTPNPPELDNNNFDFVDYDDEEEPYEDLDEEEEDPKEDPEIDLDEEEEDPEMDIDDKEEEEPLPASPPPLSPLRTPPPVSESSFDYDVPVTTTTIMGRPFKGPLSTYKVGEPSYVASASVFFARYELNQLRHGFGILGSHVQSLTRGMGTRGTEIDKAHKEAIRSRRRLDTFIWEKSFVIERDILELMNDLIATGDRLTLLEATAAAETTRAVATAGDAKVPEVRDYSYKEFMNCEPTNFKGTEGAVGLTHWFERSESVFFISKCAENDKVKYDTNKLLDKALSWWNFVAQPIGIKNAYKIPWVELKKIMIKQYCPRNEVQKLEVKLWNHMVKGVDMMNYNLRF
nr:reverse transcriptase domain-containing protein [Tanacetum cinerariifolium]